MATPAEILALAKKIAVKARALIPRSSNRAIHGQPDGLGHAQNSQWVKQNIPLYVTMQMNAQRARSGVNKYRWLVDSIVDDLAMQSTLTEQQIDARFRLKLQQAGVSARDVLDELKALERRGKKRHRNRQPVLAMEQQEQAAKNAVRYRIGNCGENASLAFVMFAEYPGQQGDLTLPALDQDPLNRPWVEKIAATVSDHAFVVINRPQVDVNLVDQWLGKGDVIICDPWWFHTGDALLTNDRTSSNKRSLLDFINAEPPNLQVTGAAVRLGVGHSARFTGKDKYAGLNYYANTRDVITGQLRRAKWQPDSAVTRCPLCQKVFFSDRLGLTPRKHHCRKCGRVVCAACSQGTKIVPFPATDDSGVPSVSDGAVRVCNTCNV